MKGMVNNMENSLKNAIAKAKRESKKVDYDSEQTKDIAIIVAHEYLLRGDETKILIEKLEKYVEKMNNIYSLSFDEFVKFVEGR